MKTISPWVFAGLVIMNIALLVIIWMGHPRGGAPFPHPPFGAPQNGPRLQHVLESKLNFDENQKQAYEVLIHEHRQQIDSLHQAIQEAKRDLYSKGLSQNDSIITQKQNQIANLIAKQEKINFEHFRKVRDKICNPQQKQMLDDMIGEVLEQVSRPPR
ncbi:Spy/CpxP family protein refolding chaperone [Flectobacillus roseus]|uniref:Periplasmic heavy metal sensor n=1 Tax=Flectobacillus roseus TaxID=502259 RepID=A0ABT6Y7J7_9BACT|nr:hypothetical protein [Flectobacillus roseus]MDI9859545.1 hypothetical protein [Flectobacillus roseus]